MADVPAADIADAVAAALLPDRGEIATDIAPLTLRCDGYALVQLLAGAARTFAGTGPLTLSVAPEGDGAVLDLAWPGPPPPIAALDAWLAEPLAGGYATFTRRDALDSHGTDIWPEATATGARLRLPLRSARPETGHAPAGPRPEFYDFDLLAETAAGIDDERPLADLRYVVFDTETTGLAASGADEICQIAAVRIVNGRLLSGESLDLLVDPERPIPAAATSVHRITDAMVAGAPTIAEAGRRFHRFCEDAVLVAHNAPFDMAFLRRHEPRIGVRFANPVLDTVLLSAILYGDTAEHSLDALAARLGVTIPAEARHTALGDATATALVLQKLVPLLAQSGIATLGHALRESRRHGRLLQAVD
jgi:DNA polymerase-3 subunit epsilon